MNHKQRIAIRITAAAAIVGLLGFYGWQRWVGEAVAEPELGQVKVITSANQLGLPLDAYRDTPQAARVNDTAHDILLRDCLRRFGFDIPAPDRSGPYPEDLGLRKYGIIDAQQAATRGYHSNSNQDERVARIKTNSALFSDTARKVVTGDVSTVAGQSVPKGGCGAEAEKALGGDIPAAAKDRLADKLAAKASERTSADSRVLKAEADWSACMKQAGFSYAKPADAAGDKQWDMTVSEPSDVELSTAKADAACKLETNFAGIRLAIESAHQQTLIDENAQALAEIRAWRDRIASQAARVVGGK